MNLDVATVVRATGASVTRLSAGEAPVVDGLRTVDLGQTFGAVAIDSRAIAQGDLFVALPGERVDGHQFVGAAISAGARGCIVSRPLDLSGDIAGRAYLFAVPDTLTALQSLARYWRLGHSAEIIGVTGSIGKTTTKEIVAGLLAGVGPVLKSEANLNTEIGLPLMLLRLRQQHVAAVLEMGMYAEGDIALLAEIARPRIGMVTNVGPIHLERLGSIERIARAKSELVQALPPDGLAILNSDDPWTRAMARTSGIARVVMAGLSDEADLRADNVESHGLDGFSFELVAEGRAFPCVSMVPGTHLVHAFLFAAAAARELGMEWDAIADAVPQVRLEERQRFIRQGSLLIIDDSYNAAPLSMRAALTLLGHVQGTKIALLGDMLELGPDELAAHEALGPEVARSADWLITRGERAASIAAGARLAGFRPQRIRETSTNDEATIALREVLTSAVPVTEGSTRGNTMQPSGLKGADEPTRVAVLIKGSRGMKMEEIVRSLRGKP